MLLCRTGRILSQSPFLDTLYQCESLSTNVHLAKEFKEVEFSYIFVNLWKCSKQAKDKPPRQTQKSPEDGPWSQLLAWGE